MTYISEVELQDRAKPYIQWLADAGIEAAVVPGSARNYLLKLSIRQAGRNCGVVCLYHSPKKNKFSLTFGEITQPDVVEILQRCFDPVLIPISEKQVTLTYSGCAVYVDGSYIENQIGYGAVVLQDGVLIQEFSGLVDELTVQDMHQVAGELMATVKALEWCRDKGITTLGVYYDYKGIENWATGAWRANLPLTQDYVMFMRDYFMSVTVTWHKVTSHTGDRWNEYVDKLAKRGALSKTSQPSASIAVHNNPKTTSTRPKPLDALGLAADRYRRFLPYRNFAVDYSEFCSALQIAYREMRGQNIDLSALHLDFAALEKFYFDLIKE